MNIHKTLSLGFIVLSGIARSNTLTWDTGTANWTASGVTWLDSGSNPTAWIGSSDAVFSGGGATVTLTENATAGDISLGNGYTVKLQAGTLSSSAPGKKITLNTGGRLYLQGNYAYTLTHDLDFQGGQFATGSGNGYKFTGRFIGGDMNMSGPESYGNTVTVERTNLDNSYTGNTTISNNILHFKGFNTTGFTPFGSTSGATVTITSQSNSGYGGAGVRFDPGETGSTYPIPQNFNLQANQGKTTEIYAVDGKYTLTGNIAVTTDGNANSKILFKTQYVGKDIILNGILSGSGRISITDQSGYYGNGTVHLNNGSNTYNGTITVDNSAGAYGILAVGNVNAAQYATVTLNGTTDGGRLHLNGSDATIAGLNGTAGNAQVYATGVRTLTVNNTVDNSYAGQLTGTGVHELSLTKSGTAMLTLSGISNYTGPTIIMEGALQVTGELGNTLVNVWDGAALGGTGLIAGSVYFAGNSHFDFGDLAETFTVGDATFDPGFSIADLLQNNAPVDWSSITGTSYALMHGTAIYTDDMDNVGIANAVALGDGRHAYFDTSPSPSVPGGTSLMLYLVPEPASISLLLSGLLLLRLQMRKRQ